MGYLAYKTVTSDAHIHNDQTISAQNNKQNSFWGGFALQFVNANGILYDITIMANFIVPYLSRVLAWYCSQWV